MSPARRIPIPWSQRLADLSRSALTLTVWVAAAGASLWLLGRRAGRTEIVGLARSVEYTVSSPATARCMASMVA